MPCPCGLVFWCLRLSPTANGRKGSGVAMTVWHNITQDPYYDRNVLVWYSWYKNDCFTRLSWAIVGENGVNGYSPNGGLIG
jgi:hypothetical protein